ncbi:ATPase family AAA domain-containing protein 1-B [Caerostris extrusa]|uniref:ATPase family AAA domain-containing protein 1-B n=1 Tax=Caerostris extrusa TaxID=172846 RepID=A0AAV4YD25_CAEEX|nr:ATPase family AAA domain-containing protein 1-B [Caerostris extrusa]
MSGDKLVSAQITRNEVISLVFRLTLFGALTYFGVRWMVKAIDPTRKQKVEAQKRAERILNRIGVKNVRLSEYELSIAAQLVDPKTISISWDDIAGLEDIIQEIRETVILPIQKRVLLHGPPGCGKTMIAKATAKEAGARFINLEVSSLTDKWYGESQKLAAAVFTLAIKIQPCIIFIDEIDSFLRSRDTFDHEATAMMKAQFMSLWDGLITDPDCQVIVMGATNRPHDVDRAILRRMPSMFHIGLPNAKQRTGVLKLVLENEVVAEDVSMEEIAKLTDGFSGSDLRELCRNAALYRVRDYCNAEIKNKTDDKANSTSDGEVFHDALRPITMDDFLNALARMKDSKVHTSIKYRSRVPDLD